MLASYINILYYIYYNSHFVSNIRILQKNIRNFSYTFHGFFPHLLLSSPVFDYPDGFVFALLLEVVTDSCENRTRSFEYSFYKYLKFLHIFHILVSKLLRSFETKKIVDLFYRIYHKLVIQISNMDILGCGLPYMSIQ